MTLFSETFGKPPIDMIRQKTRLKTQYPSRPVGRRILEFVVAPSPLNTLLEDVPVLPETLLNRPVDCVLLGVSGAW